MHFPEKDKIFSELDKLLISPTKLIIGLSGGPDSSLAFAVLQDFYRQKGWDQQLLIIAHFHHGQRKESDKELQKIFKLYENYHIYYNTNKPRQGHKETILRDLRMRFFKEVAKKEKSIYIVTGHHLDDRIETSFMNILRGTSLHGLGNMTFRDYSDGLFRLRPLISLQKRYIQELCDVHNMPYFLDPTNKNSSLTIRNALRNDIFPQMSVLSPQNKWYESWALIYRQIERMDIERNNDHLAIVQRPTHPNRGASFSYQITQRSPRRVNEYTETDWIFLFQQLGIYKHVSQKTLAEWTRFSNTSNDGYKFLAGVFFFHSHGKIYAINGKKDFREHKNDEILKITGKEKYLYFDSMKIKNNPLWEGGVIRYSKPGDIYKGKRVKKWMLNEKIPIFWREFVPVIEKEGKIIDVVKDVVPMFYLR